MVKKIIIKKSDIDDLASSLTHLNQEVRQLSGKTFNFSHDVMLLPDVSISKIEIGQFSMFHGVSDPEYLSFTIPRNNVDIMVNGVNVDSDSIYIIPPQEEIIAVFKHKLIGHHLALKKDFLENFVDADTLNESLCRSESIWSGQVIIENLDEVKTTIRETIDYALVMYDGISDILINDIQDKLANSVRLMFEGIVPYKKNTPYNKRKAIVVRALEFIDNKSCVYISVPEIAKYAFCSIRTLEYAFKKILNITPKQYLIIRRMHMIYYELKIGSSSRVSEILYRHGVINSGRFSRDYFLFFGEYPKATKKNKYASMK